MNRTEESKKNTFAQKVRNWLSRRKSDLIFFALRVLQWWFVRRARRNIRRRPLRVLFLINNTSKWKTKTLYEALVSAPNYKPIIALICDAQPFFSEEDILHNFSELQKYFIDRKIDIKILWDAETRKFIDPMTLKPDILFYQSPWGMPEILRPSHLSWHVLTAYVPYFVPNIQAITVDVKAEFHYYLWRYYVLNKSWCKIYRNCGAKRYRLPQFVPSGHTMLDTYASGEFQLPFPDGYVIYAPHWSFNHPKNKNKENYSTFLKTGRLILDYAMQHPEMKWVFKPHPNLRSVLRISGAMSTEEIDAYYKAWENLGEACYTADYISFFRNSRAMITDCGSFLTEYACTGMPIIHLISSDCSIEPSEPSRLLFETYYQAHNATEMLAYFSLILEHSEDPRKFKRQTAVRAAGLMGVNAAQNILQNFNESFLR